MRVYSVCMCVVRVSESEGSYSVCMCVVRVSEGEGIQCVW